MNTTSSTPPSTPSTMETMEIEFPSANEQQGPGSDRVVLLGSGTGNNEDNILFGLDERVPGRCAQKCNPCCKYMPCYPDDGDVNLFIPTNVAIPIFYAMLGFLLKFPYIPLRYYLREELNATPSQQAIVYAVVLGMPWNFKMVYGFISDTCPIRGRKRKPYMFGGAILCSCSWLLFGILPAPQMGLMCLLLFTAILGMIFADVMADALVVERMKGEQSDKKGGIQSTCWMLRFTGSFFGFVIGGLFMQLCAKPQTVFFFQGLIPLFTLLPPLVWLHDPVVDGYQGKWLRSSELGLAIGGARQTRTVREEASLKLAQVWDCVQMNHIWMPMTFIFCFAATPNNGDVFANFLLGPLCFSSTQYTSLAAIGMVASLGGTWIYKKYLRAVPFRRLFFFTLLIAAGFSASQLILITRLNKKIGIPDFLFALGDEVIVDTASFIVQMPTLVMCASLCPKGVESTLYALMTVVNNIALSVGGSFSAALADALGITLDDFTNLWILTLVTSCSTLLPIFLIPMVPEGVEDCEDSADAVDEGNDEVSNSEEQHSVENDLRSRRRASSGGVTKEIARSKRGGGAFVAVLVVGLLYSIINAGIKLSAHDDGSSAPPPMVVPTTNVTGTINVTNSSSAANSINKWQCKAEANQCGVVGEDAATDDENEEGKTDERRLMHRYRML